MLGTRGLFSYENILSIAFRISYSTRIISITSSNASPQINRQHKAVGKVPEVLKPSANSNHALHSPDMGAHLQEHPHRSLPPCLLHTSSMLPPTGMTFPSHTPFFKYFRERQRMQNRPCPLEMGSISNHR